MSVANALPVRVARVGETQRGTQMRGMRKRRPRAVFDSEKRTRERLR